MKRRAPKLMIPYFERRFTLCDLTGKLPGYAMGPVSLSDIYDWISGMLQRCTENDGVPYGFRL